MRKRSWFLISVPTLFILSIVFFVYSGLNGNPITKYYFKKEVEKYLHFEYPNSEFTINLIGYGFKEMNYYGDVSPMKNKNLHFKVEENYQGELYDTLQESTQENQANQKCNSELNKYFKNSTCNADVFGSKMIIQIHTEDKKENIKVYENEIINFIHSISDLDLDLSVHFNNEWIFIDQHSFNDIYTNKKLIYE
ncbi:hypothetical protein [Paenibacillus terrigena]|uniref:YfjL-like protein n=1 Tax=Paenibacillus terrigena TaxID=369333 RepID=UPI00036BBFF9|nr:hypothetical protein [Paenibacillus terrigena]